MQISVALKQLVCRATVL